MRLARTLLLASVLVLLCSFAPALQASGCGGACPVTGAKADGGCAAGPCPAGGGSEEAAKTCPVTGMSEQDPVITTAGLLALVQARVPMTIVDARAPKWDDGRRIGGAIHLAPDADEKAIARALRDRSRLIVTYCAGLKCPASAMLAKRLRTMGYRNLIEYPWGIEGWTGAGHPVREVKP